MECHLLLKRNKRMTSATGTNVVKSLKRTTCATWQGDFSVSDLVRSTSKHLIGILILPCDLHCEWLDAALSETQHPKNSSISTAARNTASLLFPRNSAPRVHHKTSLRHHSYRDMLSRTCDTRSLLPRPVSILETRRGSKTRKRARRMHTHTHTHAAHFGRSARFRFPHQARQSVTRTATHTATQTHVQIHAFARTHMECPPSMPSNAFHL